MTDLPLPLRAARRRPSRRVVALALLSLTGATALAALYGLRDRTAPLSPPVAAPSFVALQLGDAQPTLYVDRARGWSVSVARSGLELVNKRGPIGVTSLDAGDLGWRSYAHGAARQTPFGAELVTNRYGHAEELELVRAHAGVHTWRWQLHSPGRTPVLQADGQVAFKGADGTWGGVWVPLPRIYDTHGKDVTPRGLRWQLRNTGVGGATLELRLSDASLPVPYVIDPSFVASTSTAISGTGTGTSLSLSKPASLSTGTSRSHSSRSRTTTRSARRRGGRLRRSAPGTPAARPPSPASPRTAAGSRPSSSGT